MRHAAAIQRFDAITHAPRGAAPVPALALPVYDCQARRVEEPLLAKRKDY